MVWTSVRPGVLLPALISLTDKYSVHPIHPFTVMFNQLTSASANSAIEQLNNLCEPEFRLRVAMIYRDMLADCNGIHAMRLLIIADSIIAEARHQIITLKRLQPTSTTNTAKAL